METVIEVFGLLSPLNAGVSHENQPTSIPHHRLIEARAIMLLVTTPRFDPPGGRAQLLAYKNAPPHPR